MYLCEGQVRALAKKLYKELVFPNASADDVYPYLFCQTKGYGFASVPEAIINFRLPTTLGDYVKQMKRFLKSQSIQENHFDKELVASHFVITPRLKARIFFLHFIRNPFWVLMYFCFHAIPSFLYRFDGADMEAAWTIISSTKKLHHKV
jgi:hypothetical protein